MKALFIFLVFLVCFANSFTYSQKKDSVEIIRPYFFLSANFEGNMTGKVMPSSGLQVGLGINLARVFTKKIVLGLYGETSFGSRLSSNNNFSYLHDDVNAHLVSQQTNAYDSLKVLILSDAYAGKNLFHGCFRSTIGFAFSPFPDKYGKIMFLLTRGIAFYPIYDKSNKEGFTIYHYHDITIPTQFKATLIFKPLSLTKMKDKNFLKDHLQVGFYLQKTSFQNAIFDSRRITNYLDQAFFNGNKKVEFQFGMRIGIGIGFLKRIRI